MIGNTDRRRAEGAPQLGMQRALDNADLLARKLLWPCHRLLCQQCVRRNDEIGGDELLSGELSSSDQCRSHPSPPCAHGRHRGREGQIEDLQFRPNRKARKRLKDWPEPSRDDYFPPLLSPPSAPLFTMLKRKRPGSFASTSSLILTQIFVSACRQRKARRR